MGGVIAATIDGSREGCLQPGARCPFYGFEWPAASQRLIQVGGNQCALALDKVEPCEMEKAGVDVDMDGCPKARELSFFVQSAASVISFVTPVDPTGLSYPSWRRCVMQQ